MIHPDTEIRFISNEIGYGVVAKKIIPIGTITWILDKFDREFTPDQYEVLEPVYKNILETYAYKNNLGNQVLCWDNGRFVNHSFNANCLTTAYNFELAIRDIHPGEQLTDDYGYLNIDNPFRGIDEGTKRKIVYPDDLLRYHKSWDKKLLKAFKYISKVKQPLIGLLDEELWQLAVQISKGEKEMDSILKNYYYKI
ncbi:SET domain-containing protein [Aquimarina sp. AD10]|uniref:SET domain-containing protein-lysine N-methyltransferase n=1 Tax=Aquimarina aggregata TaxID=1642818 RepID=A0A163BN82_9FLAO|nr:MULTISPECIES: SET domain-containing protein [Aquimarina]AXT58993.1 SET domain-containing protein [Aquimarina sp. AD10]KZS41577.1 SET domain-containing protein-lysine N-methyltransferase [Aquimarina aggregata]RKM95088.1 SET domain-containing protein-lysine N-methyltransferase [Aquimarina sp. AD10]